MDSNRPRARAKARQRLEQARALRDVANARRRLEVAQAQFDAALVEAVDQHVPSTDLRDALGGLALATFWRRVRTAREAVAA